jgi:hypothetical protein
MVVSRMTSTTVYLAEETLRALRLAAEERRVPMAELIREGVQKQLKWEAETRHGSVS